MRSVTTILSAVAIAMFTWLAYEIPATPRGEEPECPPEEIRPAVHQREWPQVQYALDCEHALMTGRMLPKECA